MLLKSGSTTKTLYWFLFIWTILNLVQASLTGLHADEAYYWLYSKFLDWGYFDHPPMVALFIRAGDLISHSTLGLRLFSVLSSTVSVYVLWLIVKRYQENLKLFILLVCSILLFHVYGFITTPDSPLVLFGVLFLYVYQRYVIDDKLKWAILLSLVIAGLLYSKYHGVLIILFTLISNVKILKRPTFWIIAGLSAVLFVPHIYWQYIHGFPSVYYHLFDRSAKPYRAEYTSDYLLSQVLVAGPLIGWFLYRSAAKMPGSDLFIKAVKFNFYGILIFFFLSTFKGRVEPHWTLLAFPCLLILSYLYLARLNTLPSWVKKLALANVALIVLVRFLFIVPVPGIGKIKSIADYQNAKGWAKQIKEKAGDNFVILKGGFQEASLYNFYNNTTRGYAYDTRYYRKTQFDIWPLEDTLRGKPAYYVSNSSYGKNSHEDTIITERGTYYGIPLKTARMYQKVMITTEPLTDNWKAGGLRSLKIKIYNPYDQPISFSNQNEISRCFLECGFIQKGTVVQFNPAISKFETVTIAPRSSVSIPVIIRAPSKPGQYSLVFSIRTEPFPGSRNSNMISVVIN